MICVAGQKSLKTGHEFMSNWIDITAGKRTFCNFHRNYNSVERLLQQACVLRASKLSLQNKFPPILFKKAANSALWSVHTHSTCCAVYLVFLIIISFPFCSLFIMGNFWLIWVDIFSTLRRRRKGGPGFFLCIWRKTQSQNFAETQWFYQNSMKNDRNSGKNSKEFNFRML